MKNSIKNQLGMVMNTEVIAVPLREITLHHFVSTLEKQLDIAPREHLDPDDLDSRLVRALLDMHPIPVVRHKSDLLCVGNILLFRWAKHLLRSHTEIPVLMTPRNMRRIDIKGVYWLERYLFPVMYGLNTREIHELFSLWNRMKNREIEAGDLAPFFSTKSAFARVFRISRQVLGGAK